MGFAVYAGPGPGAVRIFSRTALHDTRAPIPAYGLGTARVYHMATMNGKTRSPKVESRKKPESQMTQKVPERQPQSLPGSAFDNSVFVIHSSFVIRHLGFGFYPR